ncbi:hypothetical protein H045_05595 [Pseudomonas poae RE*1-1-14]|nr:hypothetical protein H045_05595 [Pseudomonas poae RE*1-1-14]
MRFVAHQFLYWFVYRWVVFPILMLISTSNGFQKQYFESFVGKPLGKIYRPGAKQPIRFHAQQSTEAFQCAYALECANEVSALKCWLQDGWDGQKVDGSRL